MSDAIRHIVLLGLMGAGKTTVGHRLAETLGWPHSDSDDAIAQKQHGASVRDLNAKLGTVGMHRLEADHLLEELARPGPSVISAAASVVDDPKSRRALQETGVYPVWLDGGAEILAGRFAAQPHRPVFDPDTEAVFRRQLSDRGHTFAQLARRRVSVEGKTPPEIVQEILADLDSTALKAQR